MDNIKNREHQLLNAAKFYVEATENYTIGVGTDHIEWLVSEAL